MKRIGVVFTGHGEQFIGMGKDVYDKLRVAQEFFEQAAATADINFVKLLFASSEQEIMSIRYGYDAVYLFEVCLYQILYNKGLRPDFLAGYGIGEYAAAYASRSLSFVDGLYILNKYAQFYAEFLDDKEYTVLRIVREFDLESLEALCKEFSTDEHQAYVSAYNNKEAFYVAGHRVVIEKIQEYCINNVIRKVRIIGPEYGMHNLLVDAVAAQLKLYYHKIQCKELQIPIITNVDGVYVTTGSALESALMRKVNHRIEWLEVMKGFIGCDIILIIGPGSQLLTWFKDVYPDKEYYTITSLADIDVVSYLYEQEVAESQDVASELPSVEASKNLYEADLVNEKQSDFDIDEED